MIITTWIRSFDPTKILIPSETSQCLNKEKGYRDRVIQIRHFLAYVNQLLGYSYLVIHVLIDIKSFLSCLQRRQ